MLQNKKFLIQVIVKKDILSVMNIILCVCVCVCILLHLMNILKYV